MLVGCDWLRWSLVKVLVEIVLFVFMEMFTNTLDKTSLKSPEGAVWYLPPAPR